MLENSVLIITKLTTNILLIGTQQQVSLSLEP